MTPKPRRKDEEKAREEPAGRKPVEERGAPEEEYTSYRQVDSDDASAESSEASREADLQPGSVKSKRPGWDDEDRKNSEGA